MKTLRTVIGLVSTALICYGCAVGWQINMPASYGQCHSRGSSYNALASKAMAPSGESEALQQQRANTVTGDALGTTVEADKATDLAAAKDQSQVATETAKGSRTGTGTASGDQTPTSSPKKANSKTAATAVAQTGAVAKGQSPADSDGATQEGSDVAATVPNLAELEAAVAACQKTVDVMGHGGGENGADTAEQTAAKERLAAAQAALAAAKK